MVRLTKRYYYIGEVSKILDVPEYQLRDWENRMNGYIRVRRDRTNRRHYTAKNVLDLHLVDRLLRDGLTFHGVRMQFKGGRNGGHSSKLQPTTPAWVTTDHAEGVGEVVS